VIVNQLSKDASTQTVAMAIYGAARTAPTPATNAIGTLMLLTSTVVIAIAVIVQRRIARRTAGPAILGAPEPQAADSSAGS
jgi:ABC-type spermidine/putrescine transport system permease subunit II